MDVETGETEEGNNMRRQFKSRMSVIALMAPVFLASTGYALAAANEAEPFLQSAQSLLQKNDFRGAEIQLRNAAQKAPADGAIRMQLADLYIRQGNLRAAEAELIAAKQRGVAPQRLEPVLAEVMYRLGEFGELLRQVPAANRPSETESIVRTYRGLAELAVGDKLGAQNMLADAEQLDPKSIQPKLATVRLLLGNGDAAGAERKIDEVLALAPRSSDGLNLKGFVLGSRGDAQGALNYYNQAIKENPANTQAISNRAYLFFVRGDLAAAEKDIMAVLQANPNQPAALLIGALIDGNRGKYKEADAALTKLRPLMDQMPEAYYYAGVAKYGLSQFAQAEDYLNRYIAKQKERPLAYRMLAELAFRQGNIDRTIAMLNEAQKLAPNDPQTLGLLAQAYMARGESRRALELVDQALKVQPDNPGLKTEAAITRFASGESGAGLSELDAVFKGGGTAVGPTLVLASLRSARIGQAAEAAEALVKKEPNNVMYQQLLGRVRMAQRNYPAAEKLFRGLLDQYPGEAGLQRNLMEVYLASNRPADAKKLFEDRIAKDPKDVGSMQQLADLLAREKDYQAAAQLLTRAANAAPANPAPRLELVSLYEVQKKWPEAIKEAKALSAAYTGNATIRDALARAYLQSGDLTNAIATYRDAVRAFPNSIVLQTSYAVALGLSKNYPAAIEATNKAIAIDPRNNGLKSTLVEFTFRSKGADAALSTAQSIANATPGDPFGALLVAEVLYNTGKGPQAIAALEKTQAANPGPGVMMALSRLYLLNREPKRAIALLEAWSKSHPGDVTARAELAQLYLATNNYGDAKTQFEKLVAERPDDGNMLNNLAWAYTKANDPRARATAEKAYQIAPERPDIADTLGWIYTGQGDTTNALKYLDVAIKGLPEDPDVQYHYGVALSKANKPNESRTYLQKALASKADFESKVEAKKLLDRLSSQTR
jgi:putative PEP-CTERM system TPR-repeat lipoprotein